MRGKGYTRLKNKLKAGRRAPDDELDRRRRDALDALLDDVIAVLVLHASEDVAVELVDEHGLLVPGQEANRLLDDAAAVHLGKREARARERASERGRE